MEDQWNCHVKYIEQFYYSNNRDINSASYLPPFLPGAPPPVLPFFAAFLLAASASAFLFCFAICSGLLGKTLKNPSNRPTISLHPNQETGVITLLFRLQPL